MTFMKKLLLSAVSVSALALLVSFFTAIAINEAQAQTACSPRDDVIGHLAKKYKETPVAVGVTNKGGLVEVLKTPDGAVDRNGNVLDSWTIIVSMPDGTSCMVAAGEGWRNLIIDKNAFDPTI